MEKKWLDEWGRPGEGEGRLEGEGRRALCSSTSVGDSENKQECSGLALHVPGDPPARPFIHLQEEASSIGPTVARLQLLLQSYLTLQGWWRKTYFNVTIKRAVSLT